MQGFAPTETWKRRSPVHVESTIITSFRTPFSGNLKLSQRLECRSRNHPSCCPFSRSNLALVERNFKDDIVVIFRTPLFQASKTKILNISFSSSNIESYPEIYALFTWRWPPRSAFQTTHATLRQVPRQHQYRLPLRVHVYAAFNDNLRFFRRGAPYDIYGGTAIYIRTTSRQSTGGFLI